MEGGDGVKVFGYQKTEKHSRDTNTLLSWYLCHGISFPKKDPI